MARVAGRVTEEFAPLVAVRLSAGDEFECLVDTGFTGALVLPPAIVDDLRIPILGDEYRLVMVGGEETTATLAIAEIEWLGEVKHVVVIVKDDYLLGSQLLEDTQLFVDYQARTLTITAGEIANHSVASET